MSRRPQRAMLSSTRLNWAMASAFSWLWRSLLELRSCRLSTPTSWRASPIGGVTTSAESYRGAIFDRHGVALAMTRLSVQLSPSICVLSRVAAVQGAELGTFLADLSDLGSRRMMCDR